MDYKKREMKIYAEYLKICTDAVIHEGVFKNFRRYSSYHTVVEGIPFKMSYKYIEWIKKEFPFMLRHIDKFITSDDIGNPIKYYDKVIQRSISATTCRYIKILAEMIDFFGRLDDMDIIEIGGGYGGQCKIIYDYVTPRSYTIVDLVEPCKLTAKCLGYFGIKNVILKTPDDLFDKSYSLCISNYSFTEFDRKYQDFYAEKIIKNSDKGYMICNFFEENDLQERRGGFTKKEINNLKPTGSIFPEQPLTSKGNFLYVWV